MRRLSEQVKRRIVEHLACYRSAGEVVDLIRHEFGIELTCRHVKVYDPSSFQFSGASKWIDYHRLARDRFANEIGEIAIAHRAYRLRQLQSLRERALAEGDFNTALKALEQAAKETGNWYQGRYPRKH